MNPLVSICMGSDSDLPVMQEAAAVLEQLGVSCETRIVSAHRTPRMLFQYASNLVELNVGVVIAGAGGAAHLPGMVASLTPCQ
ncbi:MAG: 5-(carboxyamino)imidazole ribonucleotide mutase [Rhodothermales bacterium]|jgi:5-(carboxyamino)imidazole ribonucleotide mutase